MTKKRTWQIVGGIALILSVTSLAQAAGITQIGSLSGTSTISWSNINGSATNDGTLVFPLSTAVSSAGNTVQINFGSGQVGEVYKEGSTWGGSPLIYPSGAFLLSTADSTAPRIADNLTLTFLTSTVQEFGVYIQDWGWSSNTPFDASVTVTTTVDGTQTFTAHSSDGGAIFLGVDDTNGANITSVTFDVLNSGSDHFFAIGTGQIVGAGGPPPSSGVPEPTSLLMMAGGIGALVWKARKRARA